MKRTYLYLFLCFLAIGSSFAAGIGIKVEPRQVEMNSNILIEYFIEQDEAIQFTYDLGVKSSLETINLLNNTITGLSESNTFTWNVTNSRAGNYEAFVFLYPLTYMPAKFIILPSLNFEASLQKLEIYAYEETVSSSVNLKNSGNIPIFVSNLPSGFKSEASVLPITAEIDVNAERTILVSLKRPSEHYNATLTFTATYENLTKTITVPLEVYNPLVNISLVEITKNKTDNATLVTLLVENSGNVYRNLTITFSTALGDKLEETRVEAGETAELVYEFARTEDIKSLKISFINSQGKEQTISHSFSIFSLSNLPGISMLTDNKWIFIIGAVLVLAAIGYVAFKRRQKPESVSMPEPKAETG